MLTLKYTTIVQDLLGLKPSGLIAEQETSGMFGVVCESIRRRPKEGRDLYELNNLGFIRICWRKKSGPYEGEISIHLS